MKEPLEIFQNNRGIQAIFIHSSVDSAGLDPFAFRVLMHLSRRANSRGQAWPGVASIAETTLISERRVGDALRVLEARKMIVTRKAPGPGNRNIYEITAADEWILDSAPPAVSTNQQQAPVNSAPPAVSNYREGNPDEGNPVRDASEDSESKSLKKRERSKNFLTAPDAAAAILLELPDTFKKHDRFCLRLGDYTTHRASKSVTRMTAQACHLTALDMLKTPEPERWADALAESVKGGYRGVFLRDSRGGTPPKNSAAAKGHSKLTGF